MDRQKPRACDNGVQELRLKREPSPNRPLQYASAAWLILLVVASLWSEAKFALHTHRGDNELRHRLLHVVGFGSTALWFLFLSRTGRQQLAFLLGVFCLGLGLELIQCLIYRNTFEWWDLRDDFWGITLAFVLFRIFARGKEKRK